MAPRRAPTSVLKDRAETAERRVLELQGTTTLFVEMYTNLCKINRSPARTGTVRFGGSECISRPSFDVG